MKARVMLMKNSISIERDPEGLYREIGSKQMPSYRYILVPINGGNTRKKIAVR